jgi:Helix-turn-helix domain
MDAEDFKPHTTVTDPQAAAYLANPHRAVFLYPFIGRERTASDVARTYKISVKTLLYQINRLIELGLLRVTRLETRRGSPIKHYRAVADAFFVPHEATDNETLEMMVNQWSQSLQPLYLRSFAHALSRVSPDWGVRISRDASGLLHIAPAVRPDEDWNTFEPDAPMLMEGWSTDLHLDFEDAKALQLELAEMYFKYAMKKGAQRYIVRIAAAPMPENDELPPAW